MRAERPEALACRALAAPGESYTQANLIQAGRIMADRTATTTTTTASQPTVRHLRQALLWPLRLIPMADGNPARHGPWQLLRDMGEASPWSELIDEYTGDREDFHERHYNEFVSFLPYVQRFLYGEGHTPGKQGSAAESPMRVFAAATSPRCAWLHDRAMNRSPCRWSTSTFTSFTTST